MKKIASLTLVLVLAACGPKPGSSEPQQLQSETPQAPTPTENSTEMTEAELDQSSADMVAQQQADDEAERKATLAAQPFEYVGEEAEAETEVSIMRDKATGCEFIQKYDSAYRGGIAIVFHPRPDGKGGIRGCGTGTDFKKGNK